MRLNEKVRAACLVLSGALLFTGSLQVSAAATVSSRRTPPSFSPTLKASPLAGAAGSPGVPGIADLPMNMTLPDGVDNLAEYAAPLQDGALTELASGYGLAIPTTFTITRPDKKLTTSYASYFITGTSDPASPVYFGDTEIQRLGTKGTFGVHVSLAMGNNTFTFSQGGESQTVTIVRTAATTGDAPITEIVKDSMVPAFMSGVKVGGSLTVGCTAPSGATVKATFDGVTIPLTQTNQELAAGKPAAFTGKITVDGSYEADITQAAGKVTYDMTYSGASKSYTSNGQVYVAGENSAIAVEVVSYLGFVYPDLKNLANFKETVKTGARDYIKNQDNTYFELSSGGYIPKEMVAIVEGNVSVGNKLDSVSTSIKNKSEVYTFSGTGKPFYDTKISENTFFLTLYNTGGSPGVDVSGSRLASGATVETGENSVTYKLPLKGLVWGYDVAFDGGNTLLTLKYKPTSIEGMTILLDPGHGGTDPGALGLAGKTGPNEAAVNLANALATRDLLTSMGAKVVMTRGDDSYLSLDNRLKAIEECGADLFISMHHNSIAESTDANTVSGMEIYYHTGLSKSFGTTMMSSLASGLNRNNRKVSQSYYRVTLSPYAPALLLELGFMSSPVEYEKACNGNEMQKVAQAIASGVKNAIA